MARKKRCRNVNYFPIHQTFIPEGKKDYEVIILNFEELEALRLKDQLGLHQEDCAKEMDVSRQTFQLILESARQKVIEALLNGKCIEISGGTYTTSQCEYTCSDCQHTYRITYDADRLNCPNCKSDHIKCKNSCKCKCVCGTSYE